MLNTIDNEVCNYFVINAKNVIKTEEWVNDNDREGLILVTHFADTLLICLNDLIFDLSLLSGMIDLNIR